MTTEPGRGSGHRRDTHPARGRELGATELAGLGVQLVASILIFLYIGQWLDRKLGTAPWLLILGVFLGAGGSFYSMYRKLLASQRRDEEARRQ